MGKLLRLVSTYAVLAWGAGAALDFESVQLESEHVESFPGVSFARAVTPPDQPKCKAWPGDDDWPSDAQWSAFNASIDGALLKPVPPAAACYKGPNYNAAFCAYLVNNASSNNFYIDDPLTVLTQWPEGSTCMPAINATGTCTQGGFPVYVVNATTVKHVQAAVNFARNNNIRLVIKNTGHDFGGRSVGAGSLSVWTHHLESFEYLPHYDNGNYSGPAAQFGAGLEQYKLFNHMHENNITIVGAGWHSIGGNGGWFALGGHGNLASYYGLGADQALELRVVTADGNYVVANETVNSDLFFALRGGGGSTYGIVTSVVVKAYPPTTYTQSYLSIAINPPPDNNARAPLAPVGNTTNYIDTPDRFWEALAIYFRFKLTIVDKGGVDWDYLYPFGNSSFSFRTRITLINTTNEGAATLLQPLYDNFRKAGFNFNLSWSEVTTAPYAEYSETQGSNGLANTRYHSRLYPRANWLDDALFNKTMAAIRSAVQDGGYMLHSLAMAPTLERAGWPGRTAAVNPPWRQSVLHATFNTVQQVGLTVQQFRDADARIQQYMQGIRDVTPGSGSYMNEGDPLEPNWQQAFYGSNYDRLLEIKKKWDPTGVFWATTTPGSEGWEVVAPDAYPGSQNGKLCRTSAAN